MRIISKFIILIVFIVFPALEGFSSDFPVWVGPIEVISEKFSKFGGTFGFVHSLDQGDCCCGGPSIADEYPSKIVCDDQGNIIISGPYTDNKIHIFNKDGQRLTTIIRDRKVRCSSSVYWPGKIFASDNRIVTSRNSCTEVYNYENKLLWTISKGKQNYPIVEDIIDKTIFFKNYIERPIHGYLFNSNVKHDGWLLYSLDGRLISHNKRFEERKKIDETGIYFNGIYYKNVREKKRGSYNFFFQDNQNLLYVSNVNTKPRNFSKVNIFPAGDIKIFNQNSTHIYTVVFPQNKYSENIRTCTGRDGPDTYEAFAGRDVVEEYAKGLAVSKNGDVYATLYLPTKVKIIKWVRVDLCNPIAESILSKLNKRGLRLLRNEIIARYGRSFKSKDLNEFINKQPWYSPDKNYNDNMLSEIDKQNIILIKKYEK